MSPSHSLTAVTHLELYDVRAFHELTINLSAEGTSAFIGSNGAGKTTILEAVHLCSTLRSFRTAQREAMVRVGAERLIVRAQVHQGDRPILVEAEVDERAKAHAQANRQALRSRAEQRRLVPTTLFSPHELSLLQGGPAERRQLLDDALAICDPKAGAALDELDRVLRQRAALLRQCGGRLNAETETTLDVWDERLVDVATYVIEERGKVSERIAPLAREINQLLAGADATLALRYQPSVESAEFATVLRERRSEDVRRAVTTVGPHRDDVVIELDRRDARVQASQGEQRSIALALRLGVHRLVTETTGAAPILLLDDVLSELDARRSSRLFDALPAGQTLLTSTDLPDGTLRVASVLDVSALGAR